MNYLLVAQDFIRSLVDKISIGVSMAGEQDLEISAYALFINAIRSKMQNPFAYNWKN